LYVRGEDIVKCNTKQGPQAMKPRSWWTDGLSLVGICVELWLVLADWLTEVRCPLYFNNNCNLIDSSFNVDIIRNQLTSISNLWLYLGF